MSKTGRIKQQVSNNMLDRAVLRGDADSVKSLVAEGADPNSGNYLFHSVESGNPSTTNALLEAGSRIGVGMALRAALRKGRFSHAVLIAPYAKPNSAADVIEELKRDHDVTSLFKEGAGYPTAILDQISAALGTKV